MQRPVHIIVPFKLNSAKSRLSCVLTPEERRLLAFAMLRDVLDAVLGQSYATILSQPGLDIVDVGRDVEIQESDLELNDALNAFINAHEVQGWPSDILIVMADLALLTEKDVVGILNCEGDVVLCPGRGGGTNMILIRDRRFRTCYQGLSFPKHLAFAHDAGLKVSVFSHTGQDATSTSRRIWRKFYCTSKARPCICWKNGDLCSQKTAGQDAYERYTLLHQKKAKMPRILKRPL